MVANEPFNKLNNGVSALQPDEKYSAYEIKYLDDNISQLT